MDDIAIIEMLDFPTGEENLRWALAQTQQQEKEPNGCMIVAVVDGCISRLLGRFDAQTGNVHSLVTDASEDAPAVLNVGDVNGTTGQLKSLQEHGNYLRVCRWDRIEQAPSIAPDAIFRTLPQCGCGGYLGTPHFFKSFAEMSAYVFCMFCLPDTLVCELP